MKCEVCQELLEEYLDGEIAAADREQMEAHLIACAGCSASFATLTAEQELFARYDREVEVPPFLWTRVAAHTVSRNNSSKSGLRAVLSQMFVTRGAVVVAVIILFALVIAIGLARLDSLGISTGNDPRGARNEQPTPPKAGDKEPPAAPKVDEPPKFVVSKPKSRPRVKATTNHVFIDQSDVLSSDLAGLDIDERDTARHIEQTENLLRSIRNVPISDTDEEIDVTYDKALSRRLLNENVVLRRDAEMKAKFPTKTLLADLEPFLIDIANLPDRARAEDVRVIKERVHKTEIVAALLDYQDRGPNNR